MVVEVMLYLVHKATVSGGVLSLANINGANGFKIIGEKTGDQSGLFLDSAGDVNGMGMAILSLVHPIMVLVVVMSFLVHLILAVAALSL